MNETNDLKTTPVRLGPGYGLYKQPIREGAGSRFWYARVHMRIGRKTCHVKSTGTTDLTAATRFAEGYYADCLLVRRHGAGALVGSSLQSATSVHRFDCVVDEWLDLKRGTATNGRQLKDYNEARKLCLAPNGLCSFFKRTEISAIKIDAIRRYLQFAVTNSKKGSLAPTTQRNHLSTLSSILKFAYEKEYIAALPAMPKLRLTDNPRPPFTRDEFQRLCASAGALARIADRDGDERAAGDWLELQDFLIFMVATFLRAGEWKQLRQKHCRYVGGDHPYLEVSLPVAKTGQRKVVSMPEAIDAFARIVGRAGDDPERYVFKPRYPNRDTAQQLIRHQFDVLLRRTGLTYDDAGNKRTLYSLRHTSLMLRLIEGENVDLLMLARNAGTGLDMLQRFYLNSANAAMKVENLHSVKAAKQHPQVAHRQTSDVDVKRSNRIDIRTGLEEPVEIMTGLEWELERASR